MCALFLRLVNFFMEYMAKKKQKQIVYELDLLIPDFIYIQEQKKSVNTDKDKNKVLLVLIVPSLSII